MQDLNEYDLIVVGARVAGSSVALLAARAGRRVLVVDRATFPSDTLSTNYIHQPGIARLRRWGLLDELVATGCPEISWTRLQAGGTVIEGGVSENAVERQSFAPRRYVLDELMLRAAGAAGAEVREKVSVAQLEHDTDGRVTGVTLSSGSGRSTARAPLVVGADGMRSTVARLVGAPITRTDPRITCAYYSFWSDLDAAYELYDGETSWVGAVPTHDAVLVAAYFPQDRFAEIKSDAEGALTTAVRTVAPGLADRLPAHRAERMWGTGDQQNFFRQAAGPGWALVGDAGHHKDSITARGITDALIQADLLVSRVLPALDKGPERLDEQLRAYWQDRDTLMTPGYEGTLQVADRTHHEEHEALLRAVAGDPGLTSLYFDVVAGLRPATELMASVADAPAVL